jgi:hypothetical protein
MEQQAEATTDKEQTRRDIEAKNAKLIAALAAITTVSVPNPTGVGFAVASFVKLANSLFNVGE